MKAVELNTPQRLQRLTGGFAVGLGLGTVGLASSIYQHPAISSEFAGVTGLIGLFCVVLGWTCLRERQATDTSDVAEAPEAAPPAMTA